MVSVKEVIVVEGRYDKNAIRQVVDATVICTDGFQIFQDREKLELLRTLARQRGLVVLTDPDGGGQVIRGFLRGAVDPRYVKHAYVPDVAGKERRKSSPSKEGLLGVEGLPPKVLLTALRNAGATVSGERENTGPEQAGSANAQAGKSTEITKADLYRLGLSGTPDSGARRAELQRRLGLPKRMSANALLEVLNLITTMEQLEALSAGLSETAEP